MWSFLWRVVIAAIGVVLVLQVLPPFFRIVGFEVTADLWTILRVCIAGLALFYVIRGPVPTWPWPPPPRP